MGSGGDTGGWQGSADPLWPRRLADVTLDVAVPHATGRPPALEVEDCACPPGYRGASCQVRPSGPLTATAGTLSRVPPPCHCVSSRTVTPATPAAPPGSTWAPASRASATATPASATPTPASARSAGDSQGTPRGPPWRGHQCHHPLSLQGCRDHTEGPQCDKCQPGYYGDATRGTPGDCQPCPCHGPHGDTQ